MTIHTRDAPTRLLLDGYVHREADGAEARALDESSRSVEYVCSTSTIDSHGTILRQNWRLDRYARNPVVLFCHNSREIPVGTASNVRVENGRLMARVTFATEDVSEDAEECWRAVKAGLLRGISVGFLAHSYKWEMEDDQERLVLDDLELLELSVCAVPSNPDTLAQRDALSNLRAQAQRQRPTKDTPMTEQEIKALRDQLAQRDAEATRLSSDLASARATAERAVAERDARISTLTAEAERLNAEVAALTERATKAESTLVRSEVESLVGKNVDPAEVDHLIALRSVAPALYDAEMKRRASRNDALTAQVIPTAPARDADGDADPVSNFEAALARQIQE